MADPIFQNVSFFFSLSIARGCRFSKFVSCRMNAECFVRFGYGLSTKFSYLHVYYSKMIFIIIYLLLFCHIIIIIIIIIYYYYTYIIVISASNKVLGWNTLLRHTVNAAGAQQQDRVGDSLLS